MSKQTQITRFYQKIIQKKEKEQEHYETSGVPLSSLCKDVQKMIIDLCRHNESLFRNDEYTKIEDYIETLSDSKSPEFKSTSNLPMQMKKTLKWLAKKCSSIEEMNNQIQEIIEKYPDICDDIMLNLSKFDPKIEVSIKFCEEYWTCGLITVTALEMRNGEKYKAFSYERLESSYSNWDKCDKCTLKTLKHQYEDFILCHHTYVTFSNLKMENQSRNKSLRTKTKKAKLEKC